MGRKQKILYRPGMVGLFLIVVIFILQWSPAACQIDLKNSLFDLKSQYNNSKSDTQKVRLALTIGSFYLTNRMPTKAARDSSRMYVAKAEALLGKSIDLSADADAVKMLKTRILLRDDNVTAADKMIAASSGKLYCDLHFLTGSYFLEKPGEEKADLDLAEGHFLAAQHYAEKLGMLNTALIDRAYLYNVMDERGINDKQANAYFVDVLNRCRQYNAKHVEIKLLLIRAINQVNHYNLTDYLYKTISEARKINDKPTEIFCLKELADYNLRQGKIDTAELQLNNVIRMYSALGYKNLQFTYDLLAAVALVKGNMLDGMKYSLATVKTAESTGTDYGIYGFYSRVASLCRDLGLKSQSMMWYRKWQESAMKSETGFPYAAYSALANELILQGKPRQVLKTLDSADKAFKFDANRMFLIPQLRADCYVALGRLDSAEYYTYSIIKNLENRGIKDYLYYQAYQNQAEFYIKLKKFEKASPFVETSFSAQSGVIKAVDMAQIQMFKFKIDSARGNYLSAIKHFQTSKNISDSIYSHVKIKQTEQLQLQYATAERDRENLLLRNKNNLQHSELEKEGLKRKLITIALLGAFLIIGLMVYLYTAKQKSNSLLKVRQGEINDQNIQLMARQDEINEQNMQLKSRQNEIHLQNGQLNQLLQDKEWLIKEVHHRVKNNLQIISSLLNTQSTFLYDEHALAAIRDSQNRMQAISIVHQKLYQSDDLSTINLPVYIEELARSIQDSFQTTQNVRFKIDIVDTKLNAAQTVPLGLILNEAITNSVKYAFNEFMAGIITLSSREIPGNNYELVIRDNGRGLPDNFDIDTCTSLGMNLIVGLVNQLEGSFAIHSDFGTIITITFPLL